ncbi:curli production assembly/transport protein CsgE [Lutibacter sp. A80]|uniref:curli production assembly/transport protein CsgE n=1 Tax=Lutibacter sp. A80 TaxID=2918453 RepID=UPI001F06A149|nr:curli production assembly/transport protein CsgE [Lutibacter sp. A80]UMB61868.1 curli production assembly/transport protein CsgE [Lutibacter sp. A80]
MKQLYLNSIFSCLMLFFNSTYGQLNESVTGKIIIQESDNLILIKAQAVNEELIFKNDLYYNLLALKKNTAGNYSSNRQEGVFSLEPEESKNLSEIRLSVDPSDDLRIYLFIKQNNIVISKDSLHIAQSNNEKVKEEVVSEVDFALKGIVIDEVITKVGKDFHDFFYQQYSTSGKLYPFIITISEKPYFGRSSIITITSEDKKLFEFMSKPDEEFLKTAVKATLKNVNQYAKQRQLLYNNTRF